MDGRHSHPHSVDCDANRSTPVAAAPPAPGAGGPRHCPSCGAVYGAEDVYCRADGIRLRVRTDVEDSRIGGVIDGRYTIVGLLGEGATGTVYRAVQRGLGRDVAIKILKAPAGPERPSAGRFLREVRVVSCLNHWNIVTVHDFGETAGGELFLAMELLRGATLRQVMDGDGPFPVERAVRIAGEIAQGLHAAHAHGIIHRDLKPSNVIVVDPDGATAQHVKLVDFGLAESTETDGPDRTLARTETVCGTPLYMSPEQALGMELDCRSDVYALGLLVYEMLMGQPPFAQRSVPEILRAHVQEAPPPFAAARPELRVHPAIEAVVRRALSKDVGARQDSALELKAELKAALARSRAAAASAVAAPMTTMQRPAAALPAERVGRAAAPPAWPPFAPRSDRGAPAPIVARSTGVARAGTAPAAVPADHVYPESYCAPAATAARERAAEEARVVRRAAQSRRAPAGGSSPARDGWARRATAWDEALRRPDAGVDEPAEG